MSAEDILRRAGESISVRRAFGEPYEKGATLVIPVAMVAGGGGGGDGSAPVKESDDSSTNQSGSAPGVQMGSGGGFGGMVMPVGAYVVKDDSVEFVPAVSVTVILLVSYGVVRILARVWKHRRRR